MARNEQRPRAARLAVLTTLAVLASAGCVDGFKGSVLQLDFSSMTPVASGSDYSGFRPPDGTYLAFYAVDNVYELDGDGNPVLDDAGNPVITQSFLFEVDRFEVRRVIDMTSPCFLDTDDHTRFPGVHVTQYARKLRESICERLGHPETCFDNAFDPPDGATELDIIDVLTADRRMELLPTLQGVVKAVTSFSNFRYPPARPACDATGDEIPAIDCRDDASNLQRLRACRAQWERPEAAGFYEGSDKVFTLPLSGTFYGTVEGANPVNQGFVGGATINVDHVLSNADAFTINWQFKDFDGDGNPDYPADFLADHEPSASGYTWMTGRPEHRTRGTINGRLVNPINSAAYVEVAIFTDLGRDDVSF